MDDPRRHRRHQITPARRDAGPARPEIECNGRRGPAGRRRPAGPLASNRPPRSRVEADPGREAGWDGRWRRSKARPIRPTISARPIQKTQAPRLPKSTSSESGTSRSVVFERRPVAKGRTRIEPRTPEARPRPSRPPRPSGRNARRLDAGSGESTPVGETNVSRIDRSSRPLDRRPGDDRGVNSSSYQNRNGNQPPAVGRQGPPHARPARIRRGPTLRTRAAEPGGGDLDSSPPAGREPSETRGA